MRFRSNLTLFLLFITLIFSMGSCSKEEKVTEFPITSSSEEAISLYKEATQKFVHYQTGGQALLDKAIELDPSFAMAYLAKGGTKNRARALELVDGVSEGEKLRIQYAEAYNTGKLEEAKSLLDQLLPLYPGIRGINYLAGNYQHYVTRDYHKALEYFQKAVDIDPTHPSAHNMMGYSYMALEKFDEAEKALKNYVEVSPANPNALDSYAELLRRLGRLDESTGYYEKAYDANNKFTGALERIGENCMFAGEYDQAREYYQRFFDESSSVTAKLRALSLKAASYVTEGRFADALPVLDERRTLAETNKRPVNVFTSITRQGFVLFESERSGEALGYFEKAAEYLNSAELGQRLKDYHTAFAHCYLCSGLIKQDRLEEAAAELEKAKVLADKFNIPASTNAYRTTAADLEFARENYAAALELYSQASQTIMKNIYFKGRCYEALGNNAEAKKCYEKIRFWTNYDIGPALYHNRALARLAEL